MTWSTTGALTAALQTTTLGGSTARDGPLATDYFFPPDKKDKREMRHVEVERCDALSETCGGKGNLTCYMPDATTSNGGQCNFFQFERLPDNSTRVSPAQPTVPLAHAYAPAQLAPDPVAYAASAEEEQQVQEALRLAAGGGLRPDVVRTGVEETLEALYLLLAMPGIGCGGARNGSYAHVLNDTERENVCQLLQHGVGGGEPCCIDLLPDGQTGTWTDAGGSV
eukprot:CAMPEP_0172027300 /NCGR_PEP_ID=MMETSP1041-20130122/16922_1 /TAXON_ID=464988 /ORGANISM="Hemiselmis andersenii, Strain CCMP439" /LENGTH=223 /DNA_ID=CAMNT_0012683183 /DNA_START=126 /DNA_END=793 /DNA_ORIENTATION=+